MSKLSALKFLCFLSLFLAYPAVGQDSLPDSDATLVQQLTDGDSTSRKEALRAILARKKGILQLQDQFLDGLMASAGDSSVEVRQLSVALIGERWIWKGGEQEPRAIEFLLKMTHDDDWKVAYNCVYYGLSTVRGKSDLLTDRLIELAVARERNQAFALFGRVKWGLSDGKQSAAQRVQVFLDKLSPEQSSQAMLAMNLYYELVGRPPANIDRFSDTNHYLVVFTTQPPFLPETKDEVLAAIKTLLGEAFRPEDWFVKFSEGRLMGMAHLQGMQNFDRAIQALSVGRGFKIAETGQVDPTRLERIQAAFTKDADLKPSGEDFALAFKELYDQLGKEYPCFELKGINWQDVGDELLPKCKNIHNVDEFSLLCQQLIAQLQDSHAYLSKGRAIPAAYPFPRWDPGFACLVDDRGAPVVYYVDQGSAAEDAKLKIGMTITSINGVPAQDAIADCMKLYRQYAGFSSDRILRYQATRWFVRQQKRGSMVQLQAVDQDDECHDFELPANYDVRYLPRLPVPIAGIRDSANVAHTRLDGDLGYIYVRRIRPDLTVQLDTAIQQLQSCQGLVIDVRGNSGGGFDANQAFANFDLNGEADSPRPRFTGPIAVLIDARCISAGEGWTSWFVANKRARLFGEATAGASARKVQRDVMNGMFRVTYPVKAYKGSLARPIERIGITPDVPLMPNAADIANGRDTVLRAACAYLRSEVQEQ
jgi:C-terminal processing protease CtpA/Prc